MVGLKMLVRVWSLWRLHSPLGADYLSFGVFHSEATSFEGGGLGVVQESFEDGGGQGDVAIEDLRPVLNTRLASSNQSRAHVCN